MSYRFLFVIDPIAGLLPDKDTSFVLMLAAQHRGHSVYCCLVDDLFAENGRPHARARRTEVSRGMPHYSLFEERTEPLDWYGAVFMRKDPPIDQAYLFATHLLELVDQGKTFLINSPRGLRDANEKLYALNFKEAIPPSLVTSDIPRLEAFLDGLGGRMIVKPLDGCGGSGVLYLNRADRNLRSLLELATSNGRRLIMAQEYLPDVRNGDKRIIVLNGTPLGAVLRVPREEENRGNIHVGGVVQPATITPIELRAIEQMAPRLREDGLYFVGLDFIGGRLTEVNVTSPTGIQEINALNNAALELDVIAFAESRVPSSV